VPSTGVVNSQPELLMRYAGLVCRKDQEAVCCENALFPLNRTLARPHQTALARFGSSVPRNLPDPLTVLFQIAALVFMMTNAVAFGIGIVPILMIPAFANHAFEAISAVVLATFAISAPLSWFIAPRLRAEYWRTQTQKASPRP
jgi:hypothetical protein